MEPVIVPTTAIDVTEPIDLAVTEAAIEETRTKYAAMDASTPEGYKQVALAIRGVVSMRTRIEARRKELKASVLEYGKKLDGRARVLTNLVESIEGPLVAKKKAIDDEKARREQEAEAARLAEIEARLAAEREAKEAELKTARDAEEARIRAERERLEADRAAMAEQQRKLDEERARLDAIAAEARRVEEARLAEERRVEAERLANERKAEAERLAVERAAIEKERAELDALRREQAEREQARIDAARAAEATETAAALEASGMDPRAATVFGEALADAAIEAVVAPAINLVARVTVYVHGSKEHMYEVGEKFGMKGDVLHMFTFACSEIAVTLDVHTDTGEADIVAVDGRAVAAK